MKVEVSQSLNTVKHGRENIDLSVSHNGCQWTTISLKNLKDLRKLKVCVDNYLEAAEKK